MLKKLYYAIPFVLIPVVSILLDQFNYSKLFHAYLIVLLICCAVMGILTPTKKQFDFIITLVMPFSLFVTMFFGGLFDSVFLEENTISLRHAFHTACQPVVIIVYFIMALIAFISSIIAIRYKAKQRYVDSSKE